MIRPSLVAIVAAAALLAACHGRPRAEPPPPMLPETGCNADAARFAVGQPHDDALAARARDAAEAEIVRVIRPGQAVTMDYRANRLNLKLDDQGRIAAVDCG